MITCWRLVSVLLAAMMWLLPWDQTSTVSSFPTAHLRSTVIENGVVISIPTTEYLSFAKQICESMTELGQAECLRAHSQLELAQRTANSLTNPIYGRPPLSKEKIRLLQYTDRWLKEKLPAFDNLISRRS